MKKIYEEYLVCVCTKWDEEGDAVENVWMEDSVFLPEGIEQEDNKNVVDLLFELELISTKNVLVTFTGDSWEVEDFGCRPLLSLVPKSEVLWN